MSEVEQFQKGKGEGKKGRGKLIKDGERKSEGKWGDESSTYQPDYGFYEKMLTYLMELSSAILNKNWKEI